MTTGAFFRSTRTVLLGMTVAQAIPFLGSLAVARLYIPAEFGVVATWQGVVMTAAVLLTGRLEMALVIEADGEPRRFAMAAMLATICAAAVGLLVIVLGAYLVVPDVRHFSPGLVLAFLPATMLLALYQTWQSWAAADGLYRTLSWIRIAQALGVTGIQVLAGLLIPSALGLAMGYVLGLLLGIVVASRMMPVSLHSFLPWVGFKVKLCAFWAKHRRFPLFALPADFINTAAGQLPLFFISSKFGPEFSGFYALVVRILGGPISLLGTALLDVFKRSAATDWREFGNCRKVYLRTFWILAGLGIALALGVILVAESLFGWAFGETWRQAGVIATWLMPMFAMRFVASPLSYVLYIAGGQRTDLIWQCGLLGMTLFVFMAGMNFEASIKAYAAGYAGMYVIYLFVSYHYSKGRRA